MDPKWREWIRNEMKLDPDAALDDAVKADNACFQAARRDGVTLAIHLCRGNNRSHWYAEGGYDAIAEKLFGTLEVDRFLLEYDDDRSGTFVPLRFVPKGKTVVLGLVSSKVPQLESADNLARRVEEAARFIPLENLALSPQCGFASTAEGNLTHRRAAVGQAEAGHRNRSSNLGLAASLHAIRTELRNLGSLRAPEDKVSPICALVG